MTTSKSQWTFCRQTMRATSTSSGWVLLWIIGCLIHLQAVVSVSTSKITDPSTFFGGSNHASYLNWTRRVNYQAAAYLPTVSDPSYGAAVHWSIQSDDETIEVGLAVRGAATGWIGLGISENGGMRGADLFVYERAQPDRLLDMYVQDELLPKLDKCQDWMLVDALFVVDASGASETDDADGSFTVVQAKRKLDTMDTQDRAFINDSSEDFPISRVIAAWGDSSSLEYHGTKNRARGALRWYQEPSAAVTNTTSPAEQEFASRMQNAAQSTFFMGASNHQIPDRETEYAYWCYSGNDLRELGVNLDQGVTAVGFEPIVDQVEHVHHFAVMASTEENNNADCSYSDYMEFAYTYAPGDLPLALPNNVGLTVGGDNGYKSFLMEIHYDNINRISGRRDSSGVRYYYTRDPREHALGVAALGDAWINLSGWPVGRDVTAHRFTCPSSCTSLALKETVTVLREYHHLHTSGISLRSDQIRDGTIVRTGKTEYFDFNQQGMQVVQQEPFQVYPGDSFEIQCAYRNQQEREFGISSQEEMCVSFMLYYPRQTISETSREGGLSWICNFELSDMLGFDECDAEYEALGEINSDGMERIFATPGSQCMQLPQQNSFEFPSVAPSKKNSLLSPLAKEPTTSPTVSTGSPTVSKEPTTSLTVSKEPTTSPTVSKDPTISPTVSTGSPTVSKEPTTSPAVSTSSPSTIQSTILPQPYYEQSTLTGESVTPKTVPRTSTNDRQTSSAMSSNTVLGITSTVAIAAFT